MHLPSNSTSTVSMLMKPGKQSCHVYKRSAVKRVKGEERNTKLNGADKTQVHVTTCPSFLSLLSLAK